MSDNDEREELKSIRKSLKKVLSKSRYEHTLNLPVLPWQCVMVRI